MRLLHLADLHLDSPMRGLEAYEGAPEMAASCTRAAFEKAVDYALAEAVDLMVIAGDVYDGDWQDFSTGIFFARQLARLRDGGIPIVAISGNHDAASRITREITLPGGTRVLSSKQPETIVFEECGVAVHGQSFATREVSENVVASYPPAVREMIRPQVSSDRDQRRGGRAGRRSSQVAHKLAAAPARRRMARSTSRGLVFAWARERCGDVGAGAHAAGGSLLSGRHQARAAIVVLTLSPPMGRKRGRDQGSFVRETREQTIGFYRDLVQSLKAWQAPAPQTQIRTEPKEPDSEPPSPADPLPVTPDDQSVPSMARSDLAGMLDGGASSDEELPVDSDGSGSARASSLSEPVPAEPDEIPAITSNPTPTWPASSDWG